MLRYFTAIEKYSNGHKPAIIIQQNSGFVRDVEFTEIQIPVRTQFNETKKSEFLNNTRVLAAGLQLNS